MSRALFEGLEQRALLSAYLVDNAADVVDGNHGLGQLALREAITLANAHPGADSITFSPSLSGRTITLLLGELGIDDDLAIGGLGPSGLTVSGNNASRVFSIGTGVTASIRGMTITGGEATGARGGGIYSAGTLTLTNLTISGNNAGNGGGGVYSLASVLTLTRAIVSGNSADNYGGGILSDGVLSLRDSTVSGNSSGNGGGIYSSGTLTLTNSTVSGNSALYAGGGIYSSSATLALTSSTISGNSGTSGGGGIYNGVGSDAVLVSTIVALNSGGDVNGDPLSAGSVNNLIGDAGSAGGLINGLDGNIVGADPKLAPLADNGGSARTHALLAGSPARDKGTNPLGLATDQRGDGFERQWGAAVDIGAFEFGATVDDYADAGAWADAAHTAIDPNTGDGERAGSIEIPHDTDLFKFIAAGSGTAVITLDVAAGFDGWFELYDASHNFIGRQNARPTGRDETRFLAVTANRVYFILVGGWRDPSGSYTLRVDGPAAPDDHADANAWSSATNIPIGPNTGNGARAGEIEAAGDTDLLKFTASGIGTTVITLDVGTYFDGRFKVYSGAHVKLNPGDESAWINARAGGGDEAWSFTAEANQVYFILVGGWRMPGGSYTIRVDGQPAPDDHADGGDWPNARNIPLDGSGDGSRAGEIEAAGDTDLFRFTAPGSASVTITLDVAAGFDGWFEIYDSSHNLVAPRRNNGATGGDEALAFSALAGQTYFILVGGWRNPAGGYDLMVNA